MTGWYLTFAPRPDARLRLYTLPCAGGGPSMFRSWTRHLPDWIEMRTVRLPGRPGRHREPMFTDCDTAAASLADAFREPDVPYAFFGHSMGAMIGYRMTRLLAARGAPPPVLLGVASWPPHGADPDNQPDPDAPDDEFLAGLTRIGGVPPELLDEPEMLRRGLPVLRADFRLCRSYRYRAEPPLDVPVVAYAGDSDTVTPPDGIAAWAAHTDRWMGMRQYAGGHFFIRDFVPEIVHDLATLCEKEGVTA